MRYHHDTHPEVHKHNDCEYKIVCNVFTSQGGGVISESSSFSWEETELYDGLRDYFL